MVAPALDILARHRRGNAAPAESVYVKDPSDLDQNLNDPEVEKRRRAFGGASLTPLSTTQLRWYPADVERAMRLADAGDLSSASRLWTACQHDGIVSGVLSTRTDGLVQLPRDFTGDARLIDALRNPSAGVRDLFDEVFPPSELAMLTADGIGIGIGVAELVPVKDRLFPVMVRLEPEFLRYRQDESRWYYHSTVGALPITPGDGRWILHMPGGRVNPWRRGKWAAVGEPWIRKTHAAAHDNNWISKLANPARVAVSPIGATQIDRQSWFRQVMAWGLNTVFGMPVGYDVRLLESNGKGYDAFDLTIKRSEREMIVALAGQEVTVDGGSGFQNNDIHATIASSLIQSSATQLALTLNTQGIPVLADLLAMPNRTALVHWDVTPPADLKAIGESYQVLGNALAALTSELIKHGMAPDVDKIVARMGVPVTKDAQTINRLLTALQQGTPANEVQ